MEQDLCNKQEQLPEPPASLSKARLPRKPGVVTARFIQHSQWSLRSDFRDEGQVGPSHLGEECNLITEMCKDVIVLQLGCSRNP